MTSINPKRVNGTLIKHSTNTQPQSQIERETIFLVKSSTPFVSALKRITKILNKFNKLSRTNKRFQNGDYKKVKYITIKGMGRAMEKTLSLGLKFQEELQYKTEILTKSIEVLDEYKMNKDENGNSESESDDEDKETLFQKRMVSCIEVRVWIKRE
ncbi:ribonucleases P/MRP protein subunit Pop7p [[Candida] anglica]|uniref:Ribonucleases P/MRP protein subunit Pop7p n=1 Tax=[Candida] anglica TaxID=148631 RepID=A0ABP0EQT3_9ASCO